MRHDDVAGVLTGGPAVAEPVVLPAEPVEGDGAEQVDDDPEDDQAAGDPAEGAAADREEEHREGKPVEAEAVANATMRGLLRFMPSINLQLQVEANHFARGVVAPILTPQGRLDQLTFYGFYRPVPRLGSWYLEASVDKLHGESSDAVSSRISMACIRCSAKWSTDWTSYNP